MAGLLNIGEMGALALHTLVELAVLHEENPDNRCPVQEIAAKLHASIHTLHKVVRRLILLGMIEGTRGSNGGLRLAADPRNITLLQIIEGVEGTLSSNGCLFAKRVCPAGSGCVFNALTGAMEYTIREYFTNTTLADLRAAAAQLS